MSDDSSIPDIQSPLIGDKLPADKDARPGLGSLPEGFAVTLPAPIAPVRAEIIDMSKRTLCGSPFTIVWKDRNSGSYEVPQGRPLAMYCAEPLCIDTGYCTGAKFVPSYPQYTSPDFEDETRRRRQPTPAEVIAGARWAARKATGKDDPRSDLAIARFAGRVLKKAMAAIRGEGGWTP